MSIPGGENIKPGTHIKYLGVILDEHCNWGEHINTIKTKVSKGTGILYQARKVLQQSSLLMRLNNLFKFIHHVLLNFLYRYESQNNFDYELKCFENRILIKE